MDPTICYLEMTQALDTGDLETAHQRAEVLGQWLQDGGFCPTGYAQSEVDASIAKVHQYVARSVQEKPATTERLGPRIYVACLAAYNSGRLHGAWIDANQEPHELQEAIETMLQSSPETEAEEWAIHDHEGFADLEISEFASIEDVSRLATLLVEHGPAFAAFAEYDGREQADQERFEEAYCGQWPGEREFAEDLFDELHLHEIPDHLQGYIDYEKFARDLFMGDYYSADAEANGVYVFRNL